MAKSYYEFTDNKSSKFWEIDVQGSTVTVRFGKIGTEGQTKVKKWDSPAEAQAHAVKVTAEKTKKGYKKAKRPVSSKAAGIKKKASVKQQAARRSTNKAKANKPAAHGPAPTSQSELVTWLKEPGRSGAELASVAGRSTRTDRLIATHGEAPPALLAKLSHSDDRSTRARVAANPNTPAADYVRLGQQFAKEFLGNPLLDLLLLEDPAWARQLPEALLVQVLKREGCPAGFLVWASAHRSEKVQLAVAMNAKAPDQALQQLRQSKHQAVREAAQARSGKALEGDPEQLFEQAVRDRLGAMTIRELREAWSSGDIGLAQWNALPLRFRLDRAINDDALSKQLLHALSEDPDSRQSNLAAENAPAPVAVWAALVKGKRADVREGDDRRPNPYMTGMLWGDNETRVRISVAGNRKTPVAVLEALAKDKEEYVRRLVAWNPHTSVAVLEALAKDKDKWVRHDVAGNRKTPVAVLEALANDAESVVRSSVAENPKTPAAVLEALAKDKDKWVRHDVAGNPKTPVAALETLAKDKDADVRKAVAGNPNTPVALLEALLKRMHVTTDRMRQALATHAHRSPEIRQALWKDGNDKVRQAVATCPGLTQDMLEEMLKESELESDLATLLRHPNLNAKSAEHIVGKLLTTPATASAWYKRELLKAGAEVRAAAQADAVLSSPGKNPNKAVLAKRPMATVMALCAGPYIEPARLARVVGSTDWLIRAAVARNRSTPLNLRKRLASDAHPLVRALAKATDGPATVSVPCEASVGFDAKRVTSELSKLLRGRPGRDLRIKLAESNKCLASMREFLAKDEDPEVRKAVVRHAKTPEAILRALAKDKSTAARGRVAGYARTPVAVLEALAKDKAEKVRCEVAKNSSTPVAVLEALAKDGSREVRSGAARNKKMPADQLTTLSKDKEKCVRYEVANNPCTPKAIIEELAADIDSFVRQAALERARAPLKLLESLVNNKNAAVRLSVAANPCASATLLETLAGDSNYQVRAAVADNQNASVALLGRLARDKDRYVQRCVACNPAAPPHALEALAKGRWYFDVAKNRSCPASLRDKLSKKLARDPEYMLRRLFVESTIVPVFALEILAKDPDRSIRYRVVNNENVTIELLEALAKDPESSVRAAVAGHARTPRAVLTALASDESERVRREAKESLRMQKRR